MLSVQFDEFCQSIQPCEDHHNQGIENLHYSPKQPGCPFTVKPNIPAPGDHWFVFCHYRLILPVLELYRNWATQQELCLPSFSRRMFLIVNRGV